MAAESLSLNVPDDLKVVASTDSDVCERAQPTLTTVDLKPEELGACAVRTLVTKMKDRRATPQDVDVPVELIARQSSGAVAVA